VAILTRQKFPFGPFELDSRSGELCVTQTRPWSSSALVSQSPIAMDAWDHANMGDGGALKGERRNVNYRTLKIVVDSHPGRFFVKQRGPVSSVWDMVGLEERE
jgi:hypothetical protein